MKLSEVKYFETILEACKDSHSLIKANFPSMKADFERIYVETLEADQPEHVSEEVLMSMKTDMLMTFMWGMVAATDTNSTFRKNFNLPPELLKKIENKIITPEKKIIIP